MRKHLLLILLTLISLSVLATHQRAGEITYKAISNLKYEFTIITYTYTPSNADRPNLPISWGDGTSQVIARTKKDNLANNISRNEYSGAIHTFPGQGTYIISVEDPNRNDGVVNIPNSVNVPFFIQTELVINPFLGLNNSVELLSPPIDNGCANNLYLHNPAAFDIDGDSLSYRLVPCRGAYGLSIPGFVLPNEVDTSIPATFTIDSINGTILWDKPIMLGEYNIAFLIEEWRNGIRIGYVTRDMQITILACDNEPPVIAPLRDTCIMAGTTLSFEVTASDPLGDTLSISALGGPLQLADSSASFPHAVGFGTVSSVFTWHTTCDHVQYQPWQVVFTARDTFQFPQLSDIKTMGIRVISPPPENLSATAVGNSIHLSWDKAPCSRTIAYDLYRRNGYYAFDPGSCETGLPAYTGFQKIASIAGISDTLFIDNNKGAGLIHGIEYCYRVVATFADGSESYTSNPACARLKKDVPVITNVSVLETATNAGAIFVGWSKPTELDTLIYGGPFKYVVQRSDSENPQFIEVGQTSGIDDTLFYDQSGLNTTALKYAYRIDMYNLQNGIEEFIGSSHSAKSMFLQLAPGDEKLILLWSAEAPWTNSLYNIFRFNNVTGIFDSIAFSTQRSYTDSNLINGFLYRYFVESIGSYSAPALLNPIINLSQINEARPEDNEPPCPPILNVRTNCELIQNDLTWVNPEGCAEDIAGYYIYYAAFENDSAVIIDSVSEPGQMNYSHTNLPSISGCYQVRAYDSIRNISDISNQVCVSIDSCSTYRLPNYFTPNNDEYNQLFRPLPEYTSVDRVDMKIFNRWGRIVFKTNDPEINWDGKNMNNNQDCAEGVYFYVCDVFEIRLEGLSKRTISGAVTLLR